jgi:cbb3-type cytochrome oxidase subunit 3
MGDEVITALEYTFLLDFFIFLIAVLIFFFYRKIRGDIDSDV